MMCEQTGEEIDWERCPPDFDDFPESVQTAVEIFYSLGDRIYGDVGFTGKDYTNLDILYKYHKIEEQEQKDWVFEILIFLERRHIQKSQEQIKSEMDKIKRR